jgi:hypothetical protein
MIIRRIFKPCIGGATPKRDRADLATDDRSVESLQPFCARSASRRVLEGCGLLVQKSGSDSKALFSLSQSRKPLMSSNVAASWERRGSTDGNSEVRIIPGNDWSGTICARDLTPLGVAQFTFNPHGAAVNGSVTADGEVRISYFGA